MVSVCMATYNGERFIREQIDSILCQLKSEDELIISDDGSTDKTIEIIKSYNDNRIILLHHKKNPAIARKKHSRNFYYASENFENALNHAHGDYVFLSDQDDVWSPGKVERMVEELERGYDCVQCGFQNINECNQPKPLQKGKNVSASVIKNLAMTPFLGCCMAVDRKAFSYILPFPSMLIGHDLWIGELCVAKKKFGKIPDILVGYRQHGENVSPGTSGKSSNPFLFKITYRIRFIYYLLSRLIAA